MSNKDVIKQNLSITAILEHYNVKKGSSRGSYHCPFHDDKNPSFAADDKKGTATCFAGCNNGKAMDIFEIIIQMENCDFPSALMRAASISGIHIGNEKHSLQKTTDQTKKIIPTLCPLQQKHKDFLISRGIQNIDEIIRLYQMKSFYDYITTELKPGQNKKSVRFTNIGKKNKDTPSSYTKGDVTKGQIYRSLTQKVPDLSISLFVVAGEKDVWRVHDALITDIKNSNSKPNFVIISNTAGEGNIPEDFFDEFPAQKVKHVHIGYDHDKAGQKGIQKVIELAVTKYPREKISSLHFEKNKPKGYDLTDFLNEGNSFLDIFSKLKSIPVPEETDPAQEIYEIGQMTMQFITLSFEPDIILKTGMEAIDDNAPIIVGENTIITGRTGFGKTVFGVNIVNGILKHNEKAKVIFFSLELKKKALFQRLVCSEYDLEQWKFKRGFTDKYGNDYEDNKRHYMKCATNYAANYFKRFLIYDHIYTVEDIEKTLTLLEQMDFIPEFIMIDYANIMDFAKLSDNKHVEISKWIKRLAKSKNYHVQAICQANRMTTEKADGFARTENLADSDQYGRDAFTVYSIKSDETTFSINPTKNRNGKAEQAFEFQWNPKTGKINSSLLGKISESPTVIRKFL